MIVNPTTSSVNTRYETSLFAKITPNQGESMDMYRKVSFVTSMSSGHKFTLL
jgi:hypothetical protein